MEESLVQSVYQRIARRREGYSLRSLADEFEASEKATYAVVDTLEDRGLVKRHGDLIVPVAWWDEEHVELLLNVPMIAGDVFQAYCQDIDSLCLELRNVGVNALRPYAHETALEIIIGAAAGFAVAEFFKGFLSELGEKLASFIEASVEKHGRNGIHEIEIKGVRNSRAFSFSFSVKGSDIRSVTTCFESLSKSLEESENSGAISQLPLGDEINLLGDGWTAKIRRNE